MNQLDQVTRKLTAALDSARENLARCRQEAGAEAPRQALYQELAALLADDGVLRCDPQHDALAQAAARLRCDPAGEPPALCRAEETLLQSLEQTVKVRDFLHRMLRSMLQQREDQGVYF